MNGASMDPIGVSPLQDDKTYMEIPEWFDRLTNLNPE
jgi:hypothetical protein